MVIIYKNGLLWRYQLVYRNMDIKILPYNLFSSLSMSLKEDKLYQGRYNVLYLHYTNIDRLKKMAHLMHEGILDRVLGLL